MNKPIPSSRRPTRALVQTLEARQMLSASTPTSVAHLEQQVVNVAKLSLGIESPASSRGTASVTAQHSVKSAVAVQATATTSLKLTWHSVAPIPQGMTEGEGDVVNGKLYVFSGYTNTNYYPSSRVYCYDPATNVWTRLNDMPVPLTHTGTVVSGNYIYLCGGYPPNAAHTYQLFASNNVWRFNTVTDTWSALPSLPAARGSGQEALVGTTLHYFGGDDITRTHDLTQHWALNLDDLAAGWVAKAPLPTARNRLGAVSLNGKIYAIGGGVGQDASEKVQTAVEVYNPATNTWSEAAPLPTPRTVVMSAATVYNGQIILAGGETSFNVPTNQVTAYNPATNSWTQLTPLPAKRIGGICRVIDGELIYTCGHPGFNNNTWIGTFG